ncbi:hypothetical protein GCM10009865_01060 [Aeromicrobium ponti]|uniref:GT-D fold-like domain-containing protein n=1 Tax=Cytobacillus oceanisediminis TaxID=665099 RepID=A0A562K546_9BACI|nr:GT-D fold domain-containing glycosyltransferase [Cytobacillus oceanisediminis]TWH90571.1 hypothetical protein IQ19_00014 [Cytobacillus oceanisediminis]
MRKITGEYENHMLETSEVVNLLIEASLQKKPLSLARFGHSEISLAWTTYPDWVKGWKYREYNGATDNPQKMQEAIRESIKLTDIVGFHRSTSKSEEDRRFAQITKEMLEALQIVPKYVCSAWITHQLIKNQQFWDWLCQQKVVLVGRRSKDALPLFQKKGITVTNIINLEGVADIERVYKLLCRNPNWDVALISAGLPASILVPRVARDSGKIAIDFGHAIDKIIEGNNFRFGKTADEFNKINAKNTPKKRKD